jgi:hypothetical protein
MRRTLIAIALVASSAATAHAQGTVAQIEASSRRDAARTGVLRDPAKVDAAHYTVEYEDASIRILRVKMAAGDSSVMHEHPRAMCVVAITDEKTQHTMPDGTMSETSHAAGDVDCNKETTGWYRHNPKNTGAQAAEYLLIERKPAGYGRGLQPARSKKTTP